MWDRLSFVKKTITHRNHLGICLFKILYMITIDNLTDLGFIINGPDIQGGTNLNYTLFMTSVDVDQYYISKFLTIKKSFNTKLL